MFVCHTHSDNLSAVAFPGVLIRNPSEPPPPFSLSLFLFSFSSSPAGLSQRLASVLQLKYREAVKKDLSASLYHQLSETLETQRVREVTQLQSQVRGLSLQGQGQR